MVCSLVGRERTSRSNWWWDCHLRRTAVESAMAAALERAEGFDRKVRARWWACSRLGWWDTLVRSRSTVTQVGIVELAR